MDTKHRERQVNEETHATPRWRRDGSRRWRVASAVSLAIAAVLTLRLWGLDVASRVLVGGPSCAPDQFELYEHLGNLSPFFVPPNTPGSLAQGTPPGCTVSKLFLVHRHGSRHPHPDELAVIEELERHIHKNRDLFSNPRAPIPDGWSFLGEGWNNTFTSDILTAPGRQQLFDHGVALRLEYPELYTETEVLAADEDRVVESARWFMYGYYGRDSAATLVPVPEDNETVSWLTPFETCDAWDSGFGRAPVNQWGVVYLPPIAARVNGLLAAAFPGANFNATHVHGMLYACAYGTAVSGVGSSPWCPVFAPDEILHNEYEYDLRMRGFAGYGLPGDMGPLLGSLLVGNATAFLRRDHGPPLALAFGHDKTIALGIAALGLATDADYPITGPVNPARAWRSAEQTPFAAYMLWKRLECGARGEESRIQLVLNGANFGLGPAGCASDEYGSCALEDFLAADRVIAALKITHGDARWKASCKT
ncbi:phosphoglycerate mutase-like protein [Durotheca rogersii]|uniref:phosphoglycerate mutase-like protein n=1 Tax=Durotheca rogersii TaxID=419775 RepID=UPI002220CEE2|nr:phosphoglycerate mutase-like protein [Durotheca rogersii]KAI5859428.1 phosphoglycerate mutase-like protein [Durotheca rogersii]